MSLAELPVFTEGTSIAEVNTRLEALRGASAELPAAWAELIEALTIMAAAQVDQVRPLHCDHDELTVRADPRQLSVAELARLEEIGFHPGDDPGDGFWSFRFGN